MSLRHYYLQQMGIDLWLMRNTSVDDQCHACKILVIAPELLSHSSLLTNMILSIGLSKEDVQTCAFSESSDSLLQQIKQYHPQVLLVFGVDAGRCFFNEYSSFEMMRRQGHEFHGIPLVVSFHPRDVLQTPILKKQVYQDLLLVQRLLSIAPE
jgi:hypothetical protein